MHNFMCDVITNACLISTETAVEFMARKSITPNFMEM